MEALLPVNYQVVVLVILVLTVSFGLLMVSRLLSYYSYSRLVSELASNPGLGFVSEEIK